MWQGKPFIIGYPDATVSSEVLNFFIWRIGWANASNLPAHEWQLVDTPTRQDYGFDVRTDIAEQTPVTCGGWTNGNLGRSYANGSQSSYNNFHLTTGRTEGLGIQFNEQAFQGLKVDPQFLWIVGWNEWWAGAWTASSSCYTYLLADCCNTGNRYFVDNYNAEYSHDIEPVTGGFTDNYYYQLVRYARQRKGVRPVPAASVPKTINLAGDFSDWSAVGPEFRDLPGDTLARNWPSTFGNLPNYTNNTGRNDLTLMKVARDANNIYFLAQCNSNLASYTGSNWMVLFIDIDQNHMTGWEGYDYAVNLGPRTATTTTLSQNTTLTNGWAWATIHSDITYTVSGNQLMLAIPRASLGLGADPIKFDFHWADNFQTNDIADFGVDGDSAPDRRFNYRYSTTMNTEVVLLSDDFESGKQGVWAETWANGSLWNSTSASPYSGNNCAVGSYAASGQSNLIARVGTLGYGSFRLNFHYKLTNVLNAQSLQISYLATNGWVPIRQLSRDEFYPTGQAWTYDERQNVWLNFTDTRFNAGPDARFFTTNFAFRIDASALTAVGQRVFIDAVTLAADTQMPDPVSTQVWQTQDMGNAGNTGYVTTNGTTFTVSGSGLDIWNNGDAFRFLYQTHSSDGQFIARVIGITPTDPWAKAGVMIRESLDSGSRHAMMVLTPSNGLAFQQRVMPLDASATTTLGPSVAPPYWVRIIRGANTLTGYASTNGASWTQVGTVSISGFNSTALWGMAVTAHNNTLTNVATFDSVALNTPALTLSSVPNQTNLWNQPTPPIPFIVSSATVTASNLVVTANSSNQALVPNVNLVLSGTDSNRFVTVAPATNEVGSATITLTVNDGMYNSASTNFLVTFIQSNLNHPPILSTNANRVIVAGLGLIVTNTAIDPDSPPQVLTFSLLSAPTNATINPSTGVLTWRPLISQAPLVTSIRVMVSDNGSPVMSVTQSFWVTVNRPVKPQLAGVASTNGKFGLSVSGDPGPDYALQGTTNLGQPNAWVTLFTTNSPAVPFWWTDPQTNLAQRFYRVLLEP